MIRQHKRRAAEGVLLEIYRIPDREGHSSSDQPVKYPIENVSRGGLRFHSTDEFAVDERIELVLYLTNGFSHLALGRICYRQRDEQIADQYHYGVSFLDNMLESKSIY